MPRAYPEEFRRDVVEIARRNETPIAQIAKDFGISDDVIRRWLAKADVEDGLKPATAAMESAELREANKRIRLLEMENEVLRRAAVYLGRGITQNDIPASLRELAFEGIPVSLSCRVLGFSRQGYYAWRVDPVCERDWSDAHVINEIRSIRKKDSTFGYRLITDELKDAHVVMGENREALTLGQFPYSPAGNPKDCGHLATTKKVDLVIV